MRHGVHIFSCTPATRRLSLCKTCNAGESALVASVLGTSAAQQQLVPALMRVYGQADFVVGLDVDKDDYDKFSVSSCSP